jgi:2-oxoisovalerate dehydrogenase E1 component
MKESYLLAYKIRKVEQSLLDLFGKGLVGGTIHTCVGQEFSGISLASHLSSGDVVVSNHRCHGHYLAIYQDYEGLIAEILGKPHGVNQGFGGSQHIHRNGFYSSGIQGGMVPTAAGVALSNKIAKNNNIAISFIGDGTLGQGVIYETLNFISKHNLPHLIVVENNFYSQSTSQHETLSGTIADRARAFGVDYFCASTNAPDLLIEQMGMAVSFVRNHSRPALIEVQTYRLNPHSKGDDQRDPKEIDEAKERDSLNIFLKTLIPEVEKEINEFDLYVDQVIKKALETPDSIILEMDKSAKVQYSENKMNPIENQTTQLKEMNKAFHQIFTNNPEALFLGEDVKDPYGGAFKASKGLSSHFEGRVLNMPISEPSLIGISLGASTTGRLVFSEIMFGDFLALAFDQILNHAAKMKRMFGKLVKAPLIIRTPMGGGRGYGATHSQCIEKHFLGIPDLDFFVFHPRVDAFKFYNTLATHVQHPAIVFEHKLLYSQDPFKKVPDFYELYESTEKFPYTRLRSAEGADITVVALGSMGMTLEPLMKTFSEEEVYLDVIYPLDLNSPHLIQEISDSVRKTKKILFLEEGTPVHSLSDSLLSELSKRLSSEVTFHSKVLNAKPLPLPASTYLEKQVLPKSKDVENAIWELFDE